MKQLIYSLACLVFLAACTHQTLQKEMGSDAAPVAEPETAIYIPVQSPDECKSGERYDSPTQSCVITCATPQECDAYFIEE